MYASNAFKMNVNIDQRRVNENPPGDKRYSYFQDGGGSHLDFLQKQLNCYKCIDFYVLLVNMCQVMNNSHISFT